MSRGVIRIPFLSVLSGHDIVDLKQGWWKRMPSVDAVAGWGMRPSAQKARAYAAKQGLPYVSLEDGFIRSFGTGDRFPPLSMVVDQTGIYYDSTQPSDLEGMLNGKTSLHQSGRQDAQRAMRLVLEGKYSKYNHAGALNSEILGVLSTRKVLVVDQTAGDMSVTLGGANAESFKDMLQAALSENPGATVYVKTHPEVSSGRKRGYLTHVQTDGRLVVLREAVNPYSLIEVMDKVYVVTSTMGFEALMADKQVVCFGLPWYAGWGLTDDRCQQHLVMSRRRKKRTTVELFAAAYMQYTNYIDPVTCRKGDIFSVLRWIEVQKEVREIFHKGAIALSSKKGFHSLVKNMLDSYCDLVVLSYESKGKSAMLPSFSGTVMVCPVQELSVSLREFARSHGYSLFSVITNKANGKVCLRAEEGHIGAQRYEWSPLLRGFYG
ncbi:hypothetical protein [Brachymonas chironomi]|uniref:capsular polysaccharide export protein, LipB/KpsS family n=1 Tax=Brachymonas chironomi TaxID=491919 RepID=UPI001FDF6AB3|nr:hypothetical protein [Brachymonas chironomi]